MHNSAIVSSQAKCHPGTREAVLDRLVKWALSVPYENSIIWLHGPAGTGKSAIQRTLAEKLQSMKLLLASFFFFRTDQGRNSAEHFITTIAHQLSLSIPATKPYIENAVQRDSHIIYKSLMEQAFRLIIEPLSMVVEEGDLEAYRCPRVIIVDGLDECVDSSQQLTILDALHHIIKSVPIPFAVIVASRPEPDIRGAFSYGDLEKVSSPVTLDDFFNPDADIKKYLVDMFQFARHNHHLKSTLPSTMRPSSEVIDKLVRKASGQFIYASTVENSSVHLDTNQPSAWTSYSAFRLQKKQQTVQRAGQFIFCDIYEHREGNPEICLAYTWGYTSQLHFSNWDGSAY
ncbi:hypothetical protein CPB84DRAFT_1726850 [Gymnopilus junonius]|uniref:Nephrocystin 3-like N-terminal domain-containing protein n=1 Tax=Gymnopilus junonius TaxID=109634 RepID=A0A9P5NW39_GYMJU|nr:hypothetical protein CPB84DRAFT_1726850 [Gymnopilus junonius]